MACFNPEGVIAGATTGQLIVEVDVAEEVGFCLTNGVKTVVLFTVNFGFCGSDFPFPIPETGRGGGIEEVEAGQR